MVKRRKRDTYTTGLPPGTVVYQGDARNEAVKITVIDYTETDYQEKSAGAIEECFPFKDKPSVTWINVDGIHQVDIVEKLGAHFDFHSLTLEDIVTTGQRPKMEDMERYIYLVLNMISYDGGAKKIESEQVSIILGENFVISFQEKEGDVFGPVRERLRKNKGRIRKMGPDYLAYSLIDSIVDNYFVILEKFGEDIEDIEEELAKNPSNRTLMKIHEMKRDVILLRRSEWPLREIVNGLYRGESPLIHKDVGVYLRDVYDHTIQVMDTVEALRETSSGLLDIYLSSLSNKMNEIMKVLTIYAAIFIPLTFIAGVYGMNFKYMPELDWRFGYFGALGLMAAVAITMLCYFKKKKWF